MQMAIPMAVNARPVFDENGDIKNVVVFSQEQKVIEHFMQSIQHENQVISQTLSHVLQDSENNELIAVSDTIKHCLMMAKIAAVSGEYHYALWGIWGRQRGDCQICTSK